MIRALAGQTWLHVAVGMALMGSWAFFANRMHPMGDALQAAGVQAAMSGLLTALLKTLSDHLSKVMGVWWLAAGIALLISGTVLAKAHLMAGTPELLPTIAVPLLVSGAYVFIYSFLQQRGTDA